MQKHLHFGYLVFPADLWIWLWVYPIDEKLFNISSLQVASDEGPSETELQTTEPDFDYTFTLVNLQPSTAYIVTLVLNYERYSGYTIPRITGDFIVSTNQSMPGVVSITSAKCDKDE